MTLQSWFDEFMPVKASKANKTDLEALEHALKKWSGLTKVNLKKHRLFGNSSGDIQEIDTLEQFVISSSSCALCLKYPTCNSSLLSRCPLKVATDGFRCDQYKAEIDQDPPWTEWVKNQDPKPMIRLIKKALKQELEKQNG